MSNQPLHVIRKQILQKRSSLSEDFIAHASAVVTKKVIKLNSYQQAKSIAAYYPFRNELDTRSILRTALDSGKKVYLPVVMEGQTMHFAPILSLDKLKNNRFGIPEPEVVRSQLQSANSIDVIFAPLTCFDYLCNRVGMGAGYYDRALTNLAPDSPVKIGLAYEMQRVDQIASREWDIPMDLVITEENIYQQKRQ